MAIGVPAKRRKITEIEVNRADMKRAQQNVTAAVSALLGRNVRVFLNPMLWGDKGGVAARTVGSSASTVIRVMFPDGYIMEARFDRRETLQQLMELIRRAVSRPDLPFFIYTAPPKMRLVYMSMDFITAGFIPGANVYFCWDAPATGPCLREEVRSLQWLDPGLEDD